MAVGRLGRGRLLWAAVVLAFSLGAVATASAATTDFRAVFRERTTFLVCPLGTAPLGAVCFSAEGDGTADPPGGPARQTFTGYVFADPSLSCPDRLSSRSTATISTPAGDLRIAARGSQCPPPVEERGTWRALGGTGIFAGATGGGTYETTDVVVNLDGTVSSTTAYTGVLSLAP